VQGALGLSLLHLGRPWLAWKAFLGWRRSWLSREVIAFSALAGSTGLVGMMAMAEWFWGLSLPTALRSGSFVVALLSAAAAIHASAMVYRDTPRALWATRATLWRFALSAAVTGIPAFLLVGTLVDKTVAPLWESGKSLFFILAFAQLIKLMMESSVLRHRNDEDFNALWKAAQLLFGPFRAARDSRAALGAIGGILLPLSLAAGILPGPTFVWLGLILVLVAAGELVERYLFFTTAVAPRMPGGRK
jgi:DMSO reductase anchor subunit